MGVGFLFRSKHPRTSPHFSSLQILHPLRPTRNPKPETLEAGWQQRQCPWPLPRYFSLSLSLALALSLVLSFSPSLSRFLKCFSAASHASSTGLIARIPGIGGYSDGSELLQGSEPSLQRAKPSVRYLSLSLSRARALSLSPSLSCHAWTKRLSSRVWQRTLHLVAATAVNCSGFTIRHVVARRCRFVFRVSRSGSRFSVFDFRSSVSGFRLLVFGSRFSIFGFGFRISGTWHLVAATAVKCSGVASHASSTWLMVGPPSPSGHSTTSFTIAFVVTCFQGVSQ